MWEARRPACGDQVTPEGYLLAGAFVAVAISYFWYIVGRNSRR